MESPGGMEKARFMKLQARAKAVFALGRGFALPV